MPFKMPFSKKATTPAKTGLDTPSSHESVNEKAEFEEYEDTAADGTVTKKTRPVPANRAEEVLQELKQVTSRHEGEDEIEYPKAWRLSVIVLALCLSGKPLVPPSTT